MVQPSPYSACENANPLLGLTNAVAMTRIGDDFAKASSFSSHPLTGLDEERVIVPSKRSRKISKIPYKVLDAPALQDDFYLNLVDWSSTNNLAVGLSNCIYIWSASNSKVTKLHDLGPRDQVTSVCWSKRGQHLSIGTNSGVVQVWDINKTKLLRVLKGHEGRVGAIGWSQIDSAARSQTARRLFRIITRPQAGGLRTQVVV
jgi:cell division cycle 20-like protein 1 (cofactor of APC complex)